jgi:4-alpha-glucanotransferase
MRHDRTLEPHLLTAMPKPSFMISPFEQRTSGILMHVTSLPGPHGSGELGPEAFRFCDYLADAGQSWWQMLPNGPPGSDPAFSPYDSPSAFAGSAAFVSLEVLKSEGLLTKSDLAPVPGLLRNRVNYPAVLRFRDERLRRAFRVFHQRRGERSRACREFCQANEDWLDDFALFTALRRASGGRPWMDWEPGIRGREPTALRVARQRLAEEMALHRFIQFEFDRQWRALREYAAGRGIGLIGDLPIFVAQDSADVWSHPELFRLDGAGRGKYVSGYPPDQFDPGGQRWGHPQYAWRAHEATGFAWWVRRVQRMFELFDTVRIDHFLGFTRTWSIPARSTGAAGGRWVKSPGFKLFSAVERRLGRLPMIAEDLGHVTPADIRLRDAFGFAQMRLFQFGFGADTDANGHRPHNFTRMTVAYTGNHDNDTTAGWFRKLRAAERQRVIAYTGGPDAAPHLAAMRALMASPASLVIFPLQDVLGLATEARMNIPGTITGNWQWRLKAALTAKSAERLRRLTELFGRGVAPPVLP